MIRKKLVDVCLAATVLLLTPLSAWADDFGSEGNPGVNGSGVWLIGTTTWDVARRNLTAAYSNGVGASLNASY